MLGYLEKLKNYRLVLVWLLIIVVWELAGRGGLLNPAFIATPTGIVQSFGDKNWLALFGIDTLYSVARLVLGLLAGYFGANLLILTGVLVPDFMKMLHQLNRVIRYLPPPVIIPLAVLFFGINEGATLAVIGFGSLLLYLDYLLNLAANELSRYRTLLTSWRTKSIIEFWAFLWPMGNFLNYRTIPGIVVWTLSLGVFSEIILGSKEGFGTRLQQFQQLYQTNYLYAEITGIILVAFLLERILVGFFAQYTWTNLKKICASLLIVLSLVSAFVLFPKTSGIQTSSRTIATYKAAANLPLYVMARKFNRLNFSLLEVGSGVQAVDALQAGRADIAGFADIPNAIAAVNSNSKLKLSSQLIEESSQPSLFFLSNKVLTPGDYSQLQKGRIGYFPNNPLLAKGLDLVLLQNKAKTTSLEYVSSNDPTSLHQSFASGQLEGILTIEPYASDLEKQTGHQRLNQNTSFISSLKIEKLPLAAMVVDTNSLSTQEIQTFQQDMVSSLEFIRSNTQNGQATGELKEILGQKNINPDSYISAYQSDSEIKPENLDQLFELVKTFGIVDQNTTKKPGDYYLS